MMRFSFPGVAWRLAAALTFAALSSCEKKINPPLSPSGRWGVMMTFDVNGEERRAKIYPSTVTNEPSPALIYFHGNNGSAADSETRRQFHELWPEAVVIYAEGRDLDANGIAPDGSLSWELRFPYKADLPGGAGQTSDLAYVDRLLDHLATDHNVDRDRIFACGHSSGAFFTLSLMEHRADVISGFAALGAFAGYKVEPDSNGSQAINANVRIAPLTAPQDRAATPRPAYYLFGDQDTVFDGNNPKPNLTGFTPTGDCWAGWTLRQLLIRNRITPPPGPIWATPGVTDFEGPASGASVRYRLYSGTHSWPNGANQWVIDWFRSL